jgi:hypothetical protein
MAQAERMPLRGQYGRDKMNPIPVDKGNDQNPLDYEADIRHPQVPGDISYSALTFYRNRNPNGLSQHCMRTMIMVPG